MQPVPGSGGRLPGRADCNHVLASGGLPAGPRPGAARGQAGGAGSGRDASHVRDRPGHHQRHPAAAVRLVRRVRAAAARRPRRQQGQQAAQLRGPDRHRRPAHRRRQPVLEPRCAGCRLDGGGRLRGAVRRRAEPASRAGQHVPAAGVRAPGEHSGAGWGDRLPAGGLGAGGGAGPAGHPADLAPALARHPPGGPGRSHRAARRPGAGARRGPPRPRGPRPRRPRGPRPAGRVRGHPLPAHRDRPDAARPGQDGEPHRVGRQPDRRRTRGSGPGSAITDCQGAQRRHGADAVRNRHDHRGRPGRAPAGAGHRGRTDGGPGGPAPGPAGITPVGGGTARAPGHVSARQHGAARQHGSQAQPRRRWRSSTPPPGPGPWAWQPRRSARWRWRPPTPGRRGNPAGPGGWPPPGRAGSAPPHT